jgi:uncharacterized protein with NRDE domain
MCLVAWNWQPGTQKPLLLAANRDEFYARPTEALHWWDGDEMLAGRDLTGGGTWLGLTSSGRLATLTNYRDPAHFNPDAPSRGALVADFLQGHVSAQDYLQSVLPSAANYNAFNLLVWDGTQLMGLESRHARVFTLEAGIGAVSNADFMSPWPKLEKLRNGLAHALSHEEAQQDPMVWRLLGDDDPAPDDQLPDTGIPLQRERELSPAFIATPDYGTRCSTLVKMRTHGFWIEERRFDSTGFLGATQFSA